MRVGIIGANGQLGTDLVAAFAAHEVVAWTRADFDISDPVRAAKAILAAHPDVVINTAAFHRTDECEDDPARAFSINAVAVRHLALTCREADALLVQISTDYVFDGRKGAPYTENDCPAPINTYGVSKLAGERFVVALCDRYVIIRVASLFGEAGASGKGGNFVHTMLAKARRGERIAVVEDVIMSPTYTRDAAEGIRAVIESTAAHGIYHLTNGGSCSWYAFAAEIFHQAGLSPDLRPTRLIDLAPKSPRPKNSALTSTRVAVAGSAPLRPWPEALAAYLGAREAHAQEEARGAGLPGTAAPRSG